MAKKQAVLDTSKPIKVGIAAEDKVLYSVITAIMILWMIIIIYPLIFVLSSFARFGWRQMIDTESEFQKQ